MGKELSAEELWVTIEGSHSADNRFGDSFAITLADGYTYIYKALPDGKLLSIDEWFEGYVSTLGTAESGLLYAVKYEKTNICFYEYTNGALQSAPTVSLKSTKKKIEELKSFTTACPPIRITLDYNYKGSRYWVIEAYWSYVVVYNVTENCVHEKYNNEFSFYDIKNGAVVYRFPFAPYKYGIVTDRLPYSSDDNNHFYLMDFINNVKIKLLDYGYNSLQIYEYDNNAYEIYALKKHVPVAFIKYNETCSLFEVLAFTRGYETPRKRKTKLGNLVIKKDLTDNTNDVVKHTELNTGFQSAKNVIVADGLYMRESISGTYTIKNVTSNTEQELILVKEFADFLRDCYESGSSMYLDYTPTELLELCEACNKVDSERLAYFVMIVCARLRTQKYLYNEKNVKIEFFVHDLSLGELFYKRVTNKNILGYDEKIKAGFYQNCRFNVSITLKIGNDYFEYGNELVLEDMFDTSDKINYELEKYAYRTKYKSNYYRLILEHRNRNKSTDCDNDNCDSKYI